MSASKLNPSRAVARNFFPLKEQKFPKTEIKKAVVDAARILGIESLLDHKPSTLRAQICTKMTKLHQQLQTMMIHITQKSVIRFCELEGGTIDVAFSAAEQLAAG